MRSPGILPSRSCLLLVSRGLDRRAVIVIDQPKFRLRRDLRLHRADARAPSNRNPTVCVFDSRDGANDHNPSSSRPRSQGIAANPAVESSLPKGVESAAYPVETDVIASPISWQSWTSGIRTKRGRRDHRRHEGDQPHAIFASARRSIAQQVPGSLCFRIGQGLSGATRRQGLPAIPVDLCVGAAVSW